MSDEREFRVRPGRIRSSKAQRARPFIAQALAAAQRAGGRLSYSGNISPGNRSRFGRGKRATVQANRLLTSRSRIAADTTPAIEDEFDADRDADDDPAVLARNLNRSMQRVARQADLDPGDGML